MKKYSVNLASLVLFFATGAVVGMEAPTSALKQIPSLDKNIVEVKFENESTKQVFITLRYQDGRDSKIKNLQLNPKQVTKNIEFKKHQILQQNQILEMLRITGLKGENLSYYDEIDCIVRELNTLYANNYSGKKVKAILIIEDIAGKKIIEKTVGKREEVDSFFQKITQVKWVDQGTGEEKTMPFECNITHML